MDRDGAETVVQVVWVTIDCVDPDRLAAFWSGLLGVSEDFRIGEPAQYVMLQARGPSIVAVELQRVPEPKVAKNRLHLDLKVDDLEGAASRVEELGGTIVPEGDFEEAGYH